MVSGGYRDAGYEYICIDVSFRMNGECVNISGDVLLNYHRDRLK